jgi:DNA-binding transcriptional LysR family regulator
MNFNDLALFVRVARLGSISAAARDLNTSPAAASARLAAFEKRLGARLVHRTTRQATLTEDGVAFLPHAEHLLDAAAAAQAALGREQVAPRGTLRVAAPASFGRMHIVPTLPDFVARYPEIVLDLRLSDSVVDLVEGAFDVAVRNAELADSSFVGRKLAPDRRLVVASPGYIEEHGHPEHPDDVARHACLALGAQDQWTLAGFDGKPVPVRTQPVLRINDGEALRDAACAGLGIALESTWCAGDALRRGALVPAMPSHRVVSQHALWALYPSSRELAPKVRAFIDWLVGRFGPEPYWDYDLAELPGTSAG